MGNKFKILKRVISIAIICLLVLLVFYQGSPVKIQAVEYEKDNLSTEDEEIKPIKFKSFNEYVEYLKKLKLVDYSIDKVGFDDSGSAPIDVTVNESSTVNSYFVEDNYGTTNTQVIGVDEGDIIKNDGKNIYILNRGSNTVKIINPTPANKMSLAGEIQLQGSNNNNYRYYNEMYLLNDRLIIVYSYSIYQKNDDIGIQYNLDSKFVHDYYNSSKSFVGADIYDISNKSKPKLERSIMNEGNLTSSRMVGSVLYLISNKFLNLNSYNGLDPYTEENLLVSYSDSIISNNDVRYAPVDSMYCVIDRENPYNMQNLSIVSAVDITKDDELTISSFTGTGYSLYMSLNNIYIFGQSWNDTGIYTNIYKYNVKGTSIGFVSSNKASGSMLNQFSADEFNDNLRIATTNWNDGNNVFVFDKDMKLIGKITGLAKGEQIKSCRFIGDKGYVVTYKNIDPLYVLDLSDGNNPLVTGELKIPGFSSYLHPVSENLIIGIGESTTPLYWRDENGNEIESGVKQIGVKVSLFDVSNPFKPTEVKSITIGGPGSSTDVEYDHKSFSIINDKNLISIRGIFTNKPVDGVESYKYKSQALLISYKSNSLKIEKILDGSFSYETGNRVTFIGDTLYHFTGSELAAYSFNNYVRLGSIQYN